MSAGASGAGRLVLCRVYFTLNCGFAAEGVNRAKNCETVKRVALNHCIGSIGFHSFTVIMEGFSIPGGFRGVCFRLAGGHASGAAGLLARPGGGSLGLAVAQHYHAGLRLELEAGQVLEAELHDCRDRGVVPGGKDASIDIDGLADGNGDVRHELSLLRLCAGMG